MSTPQYQLNLIHILRILLKGWKFILLLTLISLAAGCLFFFLGKPTYRVKTTFIVRNPIELERNQTLRQGFFENKRFFADEDINDEILAIAKSNYFFGAIREKFDLKSKYGENAEKHLRKNIKIKRNDTKEIDLEYTTDDTELGAELINYARVVIERKYEGYFSSYNRQMIANLQQKIKDMDSAVYMLNDSIKSIRSRYGINDYMLPVRGEGTQVARTASATQSEGLELLAAYTTQKDKVVEDRANYTSLINEYGIGIEKEGNLNTFYPIQLAHKDTKERVPNPLFLFPAIALGAILLSCIILILRDIARSGN